MEKTLLLKFTQDEDDDVWVADLGNLPWPKLREVIEWLNQRDSKLGWMVETIGVEKLGHEARGHNVKVRLETTEDREAFEFRWRDWF